MKKIIICLVLGIFLLAGASALDSQGTFKQNDCVNISQTCATCTYVNISSISNKDDSNLISNVAMTSFGNGEWRYEFCNTSTLGRYDVKGIGDVNGVDTSFAVYFDITYNGDSISSSQATLYAVLLFVLIFVFVITILGIKQLPSSNTQDEEGKILSISYLKYLRPVGWFFLWMFFIAILFLSSNIAFAFLTGQLFAQTLFTLFKICFALTPVIVVVWIIWIYRQMFHDKQMQNMLNRGIFPQGKL